MKKKVLFLMTGSIAAYKACQVISKLTQAGHEVKVVGSPNLKYFVGESTLEGLSGNTPLFDTFQPGMAMSHIELVRWADLICVAPATAHFINRIASGVGDDLITNLFLAHDFTKPFLIAPAMNTKMYLHPVTQRSIASLQQMGLQVLETESGVLACGEEGSGRLLNPDQIFEQILKNLKSEVSPAQVKSPNKFISKRILVTLGATREPIDSMRVITNLSTGKTGADLCDYFSELGFEVTCLHGTGSALPKFESINKIQFQSFADLNSQVQNLLTKNDFQFVIHCAAVSDYSVEGIQTNGATAAPTLSAKISSAAEHLTLELKKNFKILNQLKKYSSNKKLKVIGFKYTASLLTQDHHTAVQKLFAAGDVDFVVHNDAHEIDRESKLHVFHLYDKDMHALKMPDPTSLALKLGQILISEGEA